MQGRSPIWRREDWPVRHRISIGPVGPPHSELVYNAADADGGLSPSRGLPCLQWRRLGDAVGSLIQRAIHVPASRRIIGHNRP